MSLSNKALLCNLSISQWSGRKFDRQATDTVASSYATTGKVGQYSKKLLPESKELGEVHRQAGAIRAFYYEQTMPWHADGSRILSSKNYMDFTRAFAAMKSELERTVDAFIYDYPRLLQEASYKLGSLYKATDYPSTLELRGTFACEVSFMPIPDVSDFRTEILDTEKDAFLKRMAEIESQATKECWHRLHDVVNRAAHKLAQPGGVFRNSLIENMSDMCSLLPKLNVSDDPALETMRQTVESLVASISPEKLRNNSLDRSEASRKLDEMTAKMAQFMGAA